MCMSADEDAILLDVYDKHKLNITALTSLPPWRAVMWARFLHKYTDLISEEFLTDLVAEAVRAGGIGKLKVRTSTDERVSQ